MVAMKKKVLLIVGSFLLICIIALAGVGVRFATSYSDRKPAEEYVGYPLTRDVVINDKMKQMRNSLDDAISFKPEVSKIINSSEIELIPDSVDAADENTETLNKIIKKAKDGTKIILPQGTYYFGAPIKVSQKSNLTISGGGKGAAFINTSYEPYGAKDTRKTSNIFAIYGCANLRIENISFDYMSWVSAEGIITEQTKDTTTFRLHKEYFENDKKKLTGGEVVTSVFTANDGGFTEEQWPENPIELKKKSEEIFSIPMKIGQVGEKIACRFSTKGYYVSYVIHATNTAGLILENLKCYSCPGGFILATDGNSDLYCKGLKVAVPKGSERILGSNEDCLHLRNVAGTLTLKDSTFYGIGDDALNIHSSLLEVDKVEENSVIMVSDNPVDYLSFAKSGETVEFFNRNYERLGLADVKKVGLRKITFEKLPKGAEAAIYMQNVSLSPETFVNGCEVGFARARALLIQSKNCIVKDCKFDKIRLSAILVAPDFGYWVEGGFVDNLLIENNHFENCNTAINGMGVIHIGGGHGNATGYELCGAGHKNVTVLNNKFKDCAAEHTRVYNTLNIKEQ